MDHVHQLRDRWLNNLINIFLPKDVHYHLTTRALYIRPACLLLLKNQILRMAYHSPHHRHHRHHRHHLCYVYLALLLLLLLLLLLPLLLPPLLFLVL
jgi:hypothetical protein